MRYALFFLSMILLLNSALASQFRLGVAEWPPYYGKNLENSGEQADLVISVASLAGLDPKLVWHRTWRGAMVKVNGGLLEATPGWECTSERIKDFYFSDPIGADQAVIFHRSQEPVDWQEIGDLNRYGLIGTTSGYVYGPGFTEAVEKGKIRVDIAGSDLKNIRKLLDGKINAIVIDKNVGYYLLKKHFSTQQASQLNHNPKPIYESILRMMVSRKNPGNKDLVHRFNQSLAQYRQQHDLQWLDPSAHPPCE